MINSVSIKYANSDRQEKIPLQRWCLVSALQATAILDRKEVYVHGILIMESGLGHINKEQ